MAEKAFSQIKETEAQAQALIKDAVEEAAHIIKRAEEEAADAFSRFSESCKQQGSEKKRQVATTARTNSETFVKETAESCAALKQKLLSQKSKAVDAVIQMITEQPDSKK